MYHHADQSWQKMPAFLSEAHEDLLSFRLSEYVMQIGKSKILVIYHGGEPLLAGMKAIERITSKIKTVFPSSISVEFSLQTNGTLLTEKILDCLEALNISVSLSMDGPAEVHDKHRLNHAGKPSHIQVEKGLQLLLNRPSIFSGVIAVIDPYFSPSKLLEYFDTFSLPSLDLLLPDANYNRLPPGRAEDADLYKDWLLECFNLWFDRYAHLRIRFFDSILDSLVGLPSKTDAFGFGDVSLLNIETDGSYHDLDVLKITYEGASNLQLGGLSTHSIEAALQTSQIQKHRQLLSKEGLSEVCQQCTVVDICAGGAVPHRYSNEGFVNPSIYSLELFSLITHAKKRLTEQLQNEIEKTKDENRFDLQIEYLKKFEDTNYSYTLLENMLDLWGNTQKEKLQLALSIIQEEQQFTDYTTKLLTLSDKQFGRLSIQPSVYAWANVVCAAQQGESITSIDGKVISPDYSYVQNLFALFNDAFDVQRVNREDYWLRVPFGDKIKYESLDITLQASFILEEAYRIIDQWDSTILKEIRLIAPEIQFIKDFTAHPEKIVSFSDNSVPGALFVTVRLGEKLIEAPDLADSILHEYRHQKLYLLQRVSDVVIIDVPLVSSPWREELRPPSGLYHAIYVFSFLKKFWNHLANISTVPLKYRAKEEVYSITDKLRKGVETVKQTNLTQTGTNLLHLLEANLIEETT